MGFPSIIKVQLSSNMQADRLVCRSMSFYNSVYNQTLVCQNLAEEQLGTLFSGEKDPIELALPPRFALRRKRSVGTSLAKPGVRDDVMVY
jgi:hypothetical protein